MRPVAIHKKANSIKGRTVIITNKYTLKGGID
jgi:hypothetical protein